MDNLLFDKMYEKALLGYNNAYAPYSNFKVGACCLLKNGEIIYGCNVENASYGLCICAERNTLFQVYAKGYRQDDIAAFMIIAKTKGPVSPCGACRQVMMELMKPDTICYLTNLNKDMISYKVKDLLPYDFKGDNLNE